MTQDEIIELARQAGLTKFVQNYDQSWAIEQFYKLVANKEREACAKIINDSYDTTTPGEGIPEDWLLTLVELIQARGQK